MTITPTFESTRADYTDLLTKVQIKPNWVGPYTRAADYIMKHQDRYEAVAKRVGSMPWQLIACLHWREASGSFAGVLHNGERILGTGRKTRLVPAGRGPFKTWEEAAIDALYIKGYQNIPSWTIERVAWEAERFNGLGYRKHYPDVKSPYLWAGTNNYERGKYTSDGHFDRRHVDQQIGVMPLYQMLLDKSTVIEPAPKMLSRVAGSFKWLGGAVGSLFTLDSLGTLHTVHEQLSGIFTPTRVTIAVLAGVTVWIGIKIVEAMENEDVGLDTKPVV